MVAKSSNRVSEDFDEARIRKTVAEADLKEMEVRKASNELIETEEIKVAWQHVLGNLRSKLLAIPVKLAPKMQHETDLRVIETLLEDHLFEAMHELSNYDPKTNKTINAKKNKSTDTRRNGGPETAAPTKRKPVGRPRKAAQLRG
jgi:phage terminase Nu1 subunit (DNA packaging protein)